MNNADMPVVPIMDEGTGTVSNAGHAWVHDDRDECVGLTKREYFAGLAMQGMLAGGYCIDDPVNRTTDPASEAVCLADSLLAELEKEPGQ